MYFILGFGLLSRNSCLMSLTLLVINSLINRGWIEGKMFNADLLDKLYPNFKCTPSPFKTLYIPTGIP